MINQELLRTLGQQSPDEFLKLVNGPENDRGDWDRFGYVDHDGNPVPKAGKRPHVSEGTIRAANRDVKVVEHGELGPTLVSDKHHLDKPPASSTHGPKTTTGSQDRLARDGGSSGGKPPNGGHAGLADEGDARRRVAEEVHRHAVQIEPSVSAAVRQATDAAGAEIADVGSRIKTADAVADKLRRMAARGIRKYRTPEGAAEKLEDALRYTSVFDPQEFTAGVGDLIRSMQAQGYGLTRLPPWRNSGPYRGVNMTFKGPDGTLIEVQAHTRASLDLRRRNRELYEIERNPDLPEETKQEAVDVMTARASGLEMPPGADRLRKEDFT